jgi:hypothetical protein
MNDFEIPETLKTFLKLDTKTECRIDIASNLVTPEKKGELISMTALADEEISLFITRYLAHPGRVDTFSAMLADNLAFSRKIDLLKRILAVVEPRQDVRTYHLSFLNALRKLRNKAAHSYGIRPAEVQELVSDSVIITLVSDFPNAIWARIRELRDYLGTVCTEDCQQTPSGQA